MPAPVVSARSPWSARLRITDEALGAIRGLTSGSRVTKGAIRV